MKIVDRSNVVRAICSCIDADDDAKAPRRVWGTDQDTALFNTWATITKDDDLLPDAP